MNQHFSPQDVVARVRAQITKKASDDGGVPAEGDRGTATVPSDPPIDGLPANNTNTPGGGVKPYDQTLKPGDTGTGVPATSSQNAKDDAATSPTTDLSKIAARMARISAAASGKPTMEPAPEKATDAPTMEPAPAKAAGAPAFDAEVLMKMGSLLVKTESGRALGLALLEEEEGDKFASQVIQEAVQASAIFEHLGEKAASDHYNAMAQEAHYEQQKAAAVDQFNQIYNNATPAEREEIEYLAKVAAWADSQPDFAHPLMKEAFAAGMTDGAEDMEGMEAGEAMPTGEEEPAPEEITMLIQQALQEGKIDEATATALMDELAGGAGQSPEEAGAVDPAMEEEMKAAAALVAPPAVP